MGTVSRPYFLFLLTFFLFFHRASPQIIRGH
jgi:hypothetical protein